MVNKQHVFFKFVVNLYHAFKLLFILCFHKTTNNCVKECKKIKNKSKKDMQLWFVSYIDRMEIEITETRSMNAVSPCGTFSV